MEHTYGRGSQGRCNRGTAHASAKSTILREIYQRHACKRCSRSPEITGLLGIESPRKIIDVGGDSGAYAAAFSARFPNAQVILFDLPQVIEIAPQFLAKHAGGQRVQLVAGDMRNDEFPGPADLIWLSAIVHMFSAQENSELIARAARALSPGGTLAIQGLRHG
ncbi:MAG: methyltransferase [Candidatus Sumerlaeaceae bacterium]